MRPRAALIALRRDLVPVLRGERSITDAEAQRLADLLFGRHQREGGLPWPVDSRTTRYALELAFALAFDVSHDLEAPIGRRLHPRTLRTALRASVARQKRGPTAGGG